MRFREKRVTCFENPDDMETAQLQQEKTEALSDYELERGKPMPSKNHAIVQSNLTFALMGGYRQKYRILPELTLEFGRRYVPDICVYPNQPYEREHDQIRVTEPPLTAIEILSPKQNADEIMEKFDVYFGVGVKSCWFVMPPTDTVFILTPDRKIQVFHDETLTDAATGISIDLREVFC